MLWGLLCVLLAVQAQIPANYYGDAKGTSGAGLKTALFKIICEHEERSYKQLWTDFKSTDVRSDGKIWDMYSAVTNYVPGGSQQGVNYKKEGDAYNREHSFPKSWFNDETPMYTDLFHLYPTDGYINGRRSNYPFGENNGEDYTSKNGHSKLGNSTTPGYSGTVFEPADEYKGDFARTYFYMATAYEDRISGWSSPMLAGNSYPAYANWAITMLLRWAKEDPVSEKEINRNNAVYRIQRNRNPYIDYPGLEQYVWGSETSTAFDPDNYEEPGTTPEPSEVAAPVFNPASGIVEKGTVVSISSSTEGASICYTLNNGTQQSGSSPVSVTINESTTISAYAQLDDSKSQTVSASYTLKGEAPVGSHIYALVTSDSELRAGSEVLIVCPTKQVAMASQGKDIRNYEGITQAADQTITTEVNGEQQPYAFLLGGTAGSWTLYDHVENVYVSLNSDANKLHTSQTATEANAQWAISISGEGEALISNGQYAERAIKYNASAPRFATYKSGQTSVSIFAQMTEDGIHDLTSDKQGPVSVFDLNGRLLRREANATQALQNLPRGIYVINGRKVLVR